MCAEDTMNVRVGIAVDDECQYYGEYPGGLVDGGT